MRYVKPTIVRTFLKSHGKRVAKSFLYELDVHVEEMLLKACKVWNGGKKTLDREVALLSFRKHG